MKKRAVPKTQNGGKKGGKRCEKSRKHTALLLSSSAQGPPPHRCLLQVRCAVCCAGGWVTGFAKSRVQNVACKIPGKSENNALRNVLGKRLSLSLAYSLPVSCLPSQYATQFFARTPATKAESLSFFAWSSYVTLDCVPYGLLMPTPGPDRTTSICPPRPSHAHSHC